MSDDSKRSNHAHPEVVDLLRQIRAGEAVASVHEFRAAGRDDLISTPRSTLQKPMWTS